MIMHIQGLNDQNDSQPSGQNGSKPLQVGRLPEPSFDINAFDINALDPLSVEALAVEALANELYGAVPGQSSVGSQVHQAQSVGEAMTPGPQPESSPTTFPVSYSLDNPAVVMSPVSTFPVEYSPTVTATAMPSGPQPETGTKIPSPGVSALTAVENPVGSDALTAMAQQLYAQMTSASLDPNMQQALAGLKSAAFFPTGSPFPSSAAPSETLSMEALNAMVQEMSAQLLIPSVDGSFSQLTPTLPLSEAKLPQAVTDIGAVETPSPKSEGTQPSFYFLSSPVVENLGLKSESVFDVQVIRKDFPILHQTVNGKPLIWLDNAATTQKPQSVIDALSRFYERDNSNIHRAAHTLAARATDAYEAARETVQRFLGASSASEIIFARGTTEAINLVSQTYGRKYIRSGDEIVLSALEHHANIVPWQMLAQETGAVLKVIPVNDRGEILLEEYARILGPRTRFVAVTQVSNALGTILPVKEITEMAHRHGARVLIDGAQGVPHLSVNVQALDCDFYVFSGHKLFAPTGIGVLYGKRELLEDMPPWQGGGNMIRSVTFEHTIYEGVPAKFEAGTPNIADAVGLGAAIDYLNRLGLVNLEQYEHKLTVYGMEQLALIPGLRLIGTAPHKVGVLSFLLGNLSVEEVGNRLAQEGIAVRAGHHCAQPTMQRYGVTGTVRPSLAFYNTFEEIDALVEVLRTIRFR
jgi:cysteine desulfurase / selenocysteine lyase